MATWKEKGVVPDSDDEDGVDSQSTASLEGLEDDNKPENGNGEEENFQHEDPVFPEDVLGEAEPTIQQDSFPLIGQEYVEYRLEKPELPPISQSPNGFKDPRF